MRIASITRACYGAAGILVVATGACFWLAGEAVELERRAVERRVEFRQLAEDLAGASDLLTGEARRYTIFGDRAHLDAYWREVKETKTRDRVVARLKALGAPQEELDLIETAKRNSDALIRTEEAAMAAVERGDLEAARTLMFDTNYDRNKAIIMEPIAAFRAKLAARTEGDVAAAQQHAGLMTMLAQIMLAASALAFAAILYFVLNRRVVVPLGRLGAAVSRLAGQDFALEVPETARTDEIGGLARAVQVFKENGIARQRLEAEQAGERQAREERAAVRERLSAGFEAKVGELAAALGAAAAEMQGTAQAMSATADRTNGQSVAVAAAAEQASANVQTVAAASEELSSSIAEIARQVSQSAEIAGRAVTDAERTDATVQALADGAQKIGQVVTLIQDIASQTNLLALNATIEAARAGDAGKGFAVVASEVKSLANQTAKATEDIAGQIAAIQDTTRSAVEAIRGIGSTIGEISAIAAAIAAAVEEQGAATQEIARNVQQAAAGTQEVSGNIDGVRAAAVDTGAAAGQVLGSAAEVARRAETLQGEVGAYLAAVKAA